MYGTNVFNINNISVRIFPQYVLDANTITSPWVDLPSVVVNAKSNYNLLDSLLAVTTTPSLTPTQISAFDVGTNRGAGIIRVRCISQEFTPNKISDYSLTSYIGFTSVPVIPSYTNADNILPPIMSARRIYNPNNFSVIALVQYAYWSNNTSQIALERNWTDFCLNPIVIGANSFSNEINSLNSSLSPGISTRSLRARFVKNDSISTSVSSYGS
jgi:hypothetical protein